MTGLPKAKAKGAPRKPKAAPLPATGTVDEIAEILMLESGRRVEQLVADGYGGRVARGRYDTRAMVQGYIRFLRDDRRDNTASASANRKRDAQTRQIEIANARASHELGEVAELNAVLDEVTGTLRSEFMGFGASLTRDLVMRQKIEDGVDERFARAAESIKQTIAALAAGGEALDTDAEADT